MTTATTTRKRTWWQLVLYLAKRAVVMEVHCYRSIGRYVLRRPRVPHGAAAFSYHQPILLLLVVLIGVSAAEVVAVDLIVHRWASVRIPILVIGVWGLVWMVGLLLGMLTRPHAVGPDGIRVRCGPEIDIPVPWDEIASVSRRRPATGAKQPKVTVDDDGRATLHLRIGPETNVRLTLEQPTELRLPHGLETVTVIDVFVDDPTAFMREVRRHIG